MFATGGGREGKGGGKLEKNIPNRHGISECID
jgi:hypothetical protein